uniref:HMG box domain-containing protein n=1 Tax=Oxyrrhis marina TaxID=2969 RepID=A0A7S3UK64_OXYMA
MYASRSHFGSSVKGTSNLLKSAAMPAPKRAQSAYFLWMNENRAKIQKDLGTTSIGDVGKEAGKRWGTMSAAEKKPFEDQLSTQPEGWRSAAWPTMATGSHPSTRKAKHRLTLVFLLARSCLRCCSLILILLLLCS